MGWSMPPTGLASLTHYDLPLNYLAACGCSTVATNYPTAAISSLAYSDKSSYTLGAGPGCGRCFKITLISACQASPPFVLADRHDKPIPSVVVKIVDKCPSPMYCAATESKTNSVGYTIHFDLALPSPALNLSFFPSDAALYGYEDFGVWNVKYESISCEHWAGWKNESALGTDPNYPASNSLCCPYNPAFTSEVCPIAPTSKPAKESAPKSGTATLRMSHLLLSSFLTFQLSLVILSA
ncbi:uncharacterized protein MELLADRAFT_76883 [Melampsora larici-populina 98AG31]|uniref:Expansin-like EG45 domain-containing protein n=1 Tax=Melampsora larici-populina (strain 98AG31 / pathotype 3-4-7) TaxID=747676 RepID=F4R9V0_MELLP|nr:uncharacterized protein MELLADRAFT_76883 [Melampsora larici-populina 98AG31]EGG10672.1 hypothetical protein MELLADRAFT_76883 [Melampsora larici-populina 98AG31]